LGLIPTTDLLVIYSIVKALAVVGRATINISKGVQIADDLGKMAAGPVGLADDLLKFSKNIKPLPNYTDVYIHATKNSFLVLQNGKFINLSHRAIANYIKSQRITGNIRLISCNAGQANLAQNLANKLGVEVMAANDTVWLYSNGAITIGKQAGVNIGIWNIFTPGN